MTVQLGNAKVWDGSAFVDAVGGLVFPDATATVSPVDFTIGDEDYRSFIFKANGTLTVTSPGYFDFLVQAGGGGGNAASFSSPCGGAGGLLIGSVFLGAGDLTVTVGGGGAINAKGNFSELNTRLFTADGGGFGTTTANARAAGGCGGSGDDGIRGQGRDGGGVRANPAGGGGGTGQAGGVGAGNVGGVGGNGQTTTIIPSATATAQSVGEVNGGLVHFGGGGAGGSNDVGVKSAGGLGGGGNGGGRTSAHDATPGNPNTGGGGGGGSSNGADAAAGGSGVVIVRFRR